MSQPLLDMNEQKYKREAITEYLLGSLPEADAERFDELSFTDERFADELQSAENDLVDRFVQGELAGATLEKFKTHYLASPMRRERVEFARTLQTYAAQNTLKPTENFAAEESNGAAGFFAAFDFFKNRKFVLQLGFAAAVFLLLIFGGVWVFNNRSRQTENQIAEQTEPVNRATESPKTATETRTENSNGAPQIAAANTENKSSESENTNPKKPPIVQPVRPPEPAKTLTLPKIVASFVLAPSLRGSSQIKSLSIPKKTNDVNINLELESNDYSAYRVALVDETGGAKLWSSNTIKAAGKDENKRLNIRFPAKLLKSQIYSLVVSGINTNGETEVISNYSFRAVIK